MPLRQLPSGEVETMKKLIRTSPGKTERTLRTEAILRQRQIRARSKRPQKLAGEMNRTEASYAHILKLRQLAGEVLHYDYEPERLRLADNTYYVPDFRVLMADGTIEFHEVKAVTVTGKVLCEDDARVKFKVAAETHWMYGWKMVGLRKGVVVHEESLNCEVSE